MELLEVYNLRYKKLCILTDKTAMSAKMPVIEKKINQVDTLNFSMPLNSDKWRYITPNNLIKFNNEFYFIQSPSFKDAISGTSVEVKGLHLSSSLGNRYNSEIKEIGKSLYELASAVLQDSGWRIGQILNVDTSKNRSLESKEQTIFSNLVRIAELYDAYIKFNSIGKTVDFIGNNTINRGVSLVRGKNIKDISVEYNSDEMITRLHCVGGKSSVTGNDITIASINPTGKSYIEDYSYYLDQGYTMEEILANPTEFYKEMVWNANEYTDATVQQFYDDAVKKLQKLSKPKLNINVGVIDLVNMPHYFVETPVLGESVLVIDPYLNLKISAQVVSISKNYENSSDIKLEISNIVSYDDVLKELVDSSKAINKVVTPIGNIQGSFIDGVLSLDKARLNSGNSGVSTTIEGALLIETPDKLGAIKFNNGMFGIGKRTIEQKNAGIDYDYRTFGTPQGFDAEFLTTGVLNGGTMHFNLDNVKSYQFTDSKGIPYTLPPCSFLIGDSTTDYKLFFNGQTNEFKIKLGSVDGLEDRLGGLETTVNETITTEINAIRGEITLKVQEINNSIKTSNDSISALTTRVSTAEEKITPNAIVSTVTKSTEYINDLGAKVSNETFGSYRSQTAEEISAKVSKNGVISAINQTAELVQIDAGKINLNGYVTFTNLNTSGSTAINGDNVTTGKIKSQYIDTDNLIVRKALSLDPSASISWGQVTNPPSIPTKASDIGALETTWKGTTYIDDRGVYTGEIKANQILAGTVVAGSLEAQNAVINGKTASGKVSFQINGVEKASISTAGNFIVNSLSAKYVAGVASGGMDCQTLAVNSILNIADKQPAGSGVLNCNGTIKCTALEINGQPVTSGGVAVFG